MKSFAPEKIKEPARPADAQGEELLPWQREI